MAATQGRNGSRRLNPLSNGEGIRRYLDAALDAITEPVSIPFQTGRVFGVATRSFTLLVYTQVSIPFQTGRVFGDQIDMHIHRQTRRSQSPFKRGGYSESGAARIVVAHNHVSIPFQTGRVFGGGRQFVQEFDDVTVSQSPFKRGGYSEMPLNRDDATTRIVSIPFQTGRVFGVYSQRDLLSSDPPVSIPFQTGRVFGGLADLIIHYSGLVSIPFQTGRVFGARRPP